MSRSCSAEMPAAGSVGAREVFVLTAEAPAPLDQVVGLELVGSLPAHSAALLSGERRRLTTACVCSRGLAPPRAAPRLHSAWPRLLACARLGHAPSRAAGSAARRPPAAVAPRAVRASAARLLGRRGRAIQRRTPWSEGDSARLTPRLASLCGSLVLASPPGTRAARARRPQPRSKSPQTVAWCHIDNVLHAVESRFTFERVM